MKKIRWFFTILLFGLLCLPAVNLFAAGDALPYLPGDPVITGKIAIEVTDKSVEIVLGEEKTEVKAVYQMNNPSNKRTSVSFTLPLPLDSGDTSTTMENKPVITILAGEKELKPAYNQKTGQYTWSLILEPGQNTALSLRYSVINKRNADGTMLTGYRNLKPTGPVIAPANVSLIMQFGELQPGLITSIDARPYSIAGNSLLWRGTNAEGDIVITANPLKEKQAWLAALPQDSRNIMKVLMTAKEYQKAADLLANNLDKAAKENRQALRVGQAYFLEKSGKTDQAAQLWKDLYSDEEKSPYVYWYLGKYYIKQTNRLTDLYNQVKELQVHPLLQAWLAAQIPANKAKNSPPEIVKLSTELAPVGEAVILSVQASDVDGDIESAVLNYQWEGREKQSVPLKLTSFKYEQALTCTIPAPGSLLRLTYDIKITDAAKNVKTDSGETYYLNSQIPTDPPIALTGANLVLGGYSDIEHEKVENWFRSYLKMAREAGFIPIQAGRPYFFFLGKSNEMVEQYNGPLFIRYTPAPFAPNDVKTYVHRYFLSYWYGPGWNTLAIGELNSLGNALLLGEGPYVTLLRYLKNKNENGFYALLAAIGTGKNWTSALRDIYGMSPWQVTFGAYWYTYGNYAIALLIIIVFAWLGKYGFLAGLLKHFKLKR